MDFSLLLPVFAICCIVVGIVAIYLIAKGNHIGREAIGGYLLVLVVLALAALGIAGILALFAQ